MFLIQNIVFDIGCQEPHVWGGGGGGGNRGRPLLSGEKGGRAHGPKQSVPKMGPFSEFHWSPAEHFGVWVRWHRHALDEMEEELTPSTWRYYDSTPPNPLCQPPVLHEPFCNFPALAANHW